MKTSEEIEAVLLKLPAGSETKYASMTYEEGIYEALEWVLGEIDDDEFSPICDAP